MAIQEGRLHDRRVVAHRMVRDLEKAIDFYARALGTVVLDRSEVDRRAREHFSQPQPA